MFKTEFYTDAVKMEDIAHAFDKIFRPVPTGNSVPREVIRDILEANPEQKYAVVSGRAEFVPCEHREWRNGDDIITATDYELREPARVKRDPFLQVREKVPGRTSYLVKEVLERELKREFAMNSYLKGINSKQSKQCIIDLAELKNENPTVLYSKYSEAFMRIWAYVLKDERPSIPTYVKPAKNEPKKENSEAKEYKEIAVSPHNSFSERMAAIKRLATLGARGELAGVVEKGVTAVERRYADDLERFIPWTKEDEEQVAALKVYITAITAQQKERIAAIEQLAKMGSIDQLESVAKHGVTDDDRRLASSLCHLLVNIEEEDVGTAGIMV